MPQEVKGELSFMMIRKCIAEMNGSREMNPKCAVTDRAQSLPETSVELSIEKQTSGVANSRETHPSANM